MTTSLGINSDLLLKGVRNKRSEQVLTTITDASSVIIGGNLIVQGSIIASDISNIQENITIIQSGPKIGQYYKTSGQPFPSGNLDVTFQATQPWSDLSAITKTSLTDFTVNERGIYQLEFNIAVNPNTAAWTNLSKVAAIDVSRGSELSITSQYTFQNSASFYAISVVATYELLIGDVINCRTQSIHTGSANIASIAGGFDLNTYFTWRQIRTT